MYRERHSLECETNGRSVMAYKFDGQIAAILQSVELNPDWQRRIVQLTVQGKEGPDPKEILEKRRRVSRAYAEGAFTDGEFEQKLAEIDALIARTPVTDFPTLEEAAALFQNIPALWMEAAKVDFPLPEAPTNTTRESSGSEMLILRPPPSA